MIQEIAKKMKKEHLQPQTIPKDVNFIEIPDQYLDSSKIMRLGFNTQTAFSEGLDATIRWYEANRDYLRRLGDNYVK